MATSAFWHLINWGKRALKINLLKGNKFKEYFKIAILANCKIDMF